MVYMEFIERKFFLTVGYCVLIASILLPFATLFARVSTLPPPSEPSAERANRVYYWSFMHVHEDLEEIAGKWTTKQTQSLFFTSYWNWWGSGSGTVLPSSLLIPLFISQIAVLPLGFVTLLKARAIRSILPLLFANVALDFLYIQTCQILRWQATIGLWLSVIATIFIALPLAPI